MWHKITKDCLPEIGQEVLLKCKDLNGHYVAKLERCEHCQQGHVWKSNNYEWYLHEAEYWMLIEDPGMVLCSHPDSTPCWKWPFKEKHGKETNL